MHLRYLTDFEYLVWNGESFEQEELKYLEKFLLLSDIPPLNARLYAELLVKQGGVADLVRLKWKLNREPNFLAGIGFASSHATALAAKLFNERAPNPPWLQQELVWSDPPISSVALKLDDDVDEVRTALLDDGMDPMDQR